MARTRAQDYDTKRQAILHSSAELFARFGYSGTSITMIADACGVSKALLYHYYSDKEALLFDIISAHLESLIQAVEAASAAAEAPKARLEAICAALLEAYRDADAEHQIQIANLKLLPQERQEILRGMERALVVLFSGAIAEAVPEVGRGPLLKPVTMSLFGMLNWHYLWFREGKGLTRTDYARLVTALISGGAAQAVASVEADAPAGRAAKSRSAVPGAKPKAPAAKASASKAAKPQSAASQAGPSAQPARAGATTKPRAAATKPRAAAAKTRAPAKAL